MHIGEFAAIETKPIAHPRKSVDRRTVRQMIEITVAAAMNLPVEELSAKTRRTAPVAFARQISMYCAHVTFGWSLTEAGAVFSRDRTTAAHACRVVEDRRDDQHMDALIAQVEDALHQWLQAIEGCHKVSSEPAR